jgi:hypothetical protein
LGVSSEEGVVGTKPDTPEVPDSEDEHSPEDSLLKDLEEDIEINEHALNHKEPPFDRALIFLVLAVVLALAGGL